MQIVFVLLVLLLWSVPSRAATITAASCANTAASPHVQDAVNKAVSGDTVSVPAGTCTWTQAITLPSSKIITLQGQGIGQTVIINGISFTGNARAKMIIINTVANEFTARVTGFTLDEGTNICTGNACGSSHNGLITVQGSSNSVRIDHNRFIHRGQQSLELTNPGGLIDHNTFDHISVQILIGIRNGGTYGDASWGTASTWGDEGPNGIWYLEDNTFNGLRGASNAYGAFTDQDVGARAVTRFNKLSNGAIQTHGTESDGRPRSIRHEEIYRNYVNQTVTTCCEAWSTRGGTFKLFDNVVVHNGGNSPSYFFNMVTYRQADSSMRGFAPWGHCGTETANFARTGTTVRATVSGGTTYTGVCTTSRVTVFGAGAPFDGEWAVTATSVSPTTNGCANVGNGSGTWFEYTTPTSGTVGSTPGSYKSPYDGNTDTAGYRCVDQVGAGQSNHLNGALVPPIQSINQVAEPAYAWNNFRIGALVTSLGNGASQIIQHNRDYYVSPSSFNGTSGVGRGLRSARPATCTHNETTGYGVGYWSTNGGGDWNIETQADHDNHAGVSGNTHTLGEDGGFDMCSSDNSWTDDFYVPLQYPHPLITGGSPNPPNETPSITVNSPAANTNTTATTINFDGTCTDDGGCTGVTIANSLTGFSGATTTGPNPWTHTALALDPGINPVTITGSDGTLTGQMTRNVFRDECGTMLPYTNAFSLYADGTAWPTLGPCFTHFGSGSAYQIVGNKAVSLQTSVSDCEVYNGQALTADQYVSATMGQIGAGQQVRLAVRASGSMGVDDNKFALLFNVSPAFIWLGRYNGSLGLDLFYGSWNGLYTPVANTTTARIEVVGSVAHLYLDIDGVGAGAEVELDDGGAAGIDISSYPNANGSAGVCMVGTNTSYDDLEIGNVEPEPSDTEPPVPVFVTPEPPAFQTEEATVDIAGTVTDNVAATVCEISNSLIPSGFTPITLMAGDWSQDDVPLVAGVNVLTVRCRDADANEGSTTIEVVFTEPTPAEPARPARRLRLRL